MFFVSEVLNEAPISFRTPLHELTYKALAELKIPFERVETDEAISMDDCIQINERLQMKMVKTLFLCNRQKSSFYLFVTTADKPFKSLDFSNALGISRVSFAPAELMESILGVKIGAATVFGILLDKDDLVQVILDNDVLQEEWYGCSDGTTTGYMKIQTAHIARQFLPYARHTPTFINI